MCGIFGFSRLTPITRALAPFLAYAMESRGTDSWGMSNGVDVVKDLGSIVWNLSIPEEWEGGPAIFHTRAASVGAKTVENAHPFRFPKPQGGEIIGIHNGSVSNYRSLNTTHSRNHEVDSMHIFHHLAEGGDLHEICGWGAVAWFDTSGTDLLHFVRYNHDALAVVKLVSGEIVFASTLESITKALALTHQPMWKCKYALDGDQHYSVRIGDDGDTLWKLERMVFGGRQESTFRSPIVSAAAGVVVRSVRNDWPNSIGYNKRLTGKCGNCGNREVNRRTTYLCPVCATKAATEFCGDVKRAAGWSVWRHLTNAIENWVGLDQLLKEGAE